MDEDAEARLRDHNAAALPGLMAEAFGRLRPAQQQAVYRIADLFISAAASGGGHSDTIRRWCSILMRCRRLSPSVVTVRGREKQNDRARVTTTRTLYIRPEGCNS